MRVAYKIHKRIFTGMLYCCLKLGDGEIGIERLEINLMKSLGIVLELVRLGS